MLQLTQQSIYSKVRLKPAQPKNVTGLHGSCRWTSLDKIGTGPGPFSFFISLYKIKIEKSPPQTPSAYPSRSSPEFTPIPNSEGLKKPLSCLPPHRLLLSERRLPDVSNSVGIKSLANGAGYPKPPLQIHKCDTTGFSKFHHGTSSASASRRIQNLQEQSFHGCAAPTPISCAGRNHELDHNDDYHKEPFWLGLIPTVTWATRNLFQFLAEQPSQLRYIEWPSFQSTLKTAMLTLVLVALLIVALSSVDSALSYLLALFLRRKP